MDSFNKALQKLPFEIQDAIRQEVPAFYRLNKSEIVGNNILSILCNKPISIRDMDNYVRKYKPSQVVIFYESKNKYTISAFKNKSLLYYTLNTDHMSISSVSNFDIFASTLRDYLSKMWHVNIEYDLLTYYNFIKKMRKECHPDMISYFNNHIHMNTLINKIKTCLYLICNYNLIIGKDLEKELSSFQMNMLVIKHDNEKFNIYLDNIYNSYYPIIIDYISKLL